MNSINSAYESGSISLSEWGEQFSRGLYDLHSESHWAGRLVAGSEDSEPIQVDKVIGRTLADAQNVYLRNFIDDIDSGKYNDSEGKLDLDRVNNRSKLYVLRGRGTASEGFVNESSDEEQFKWVMAGSEHCKDCPDYAAEGPYYKDELDAYPGDCSTDCLYNCKCHLVRVSDNKQSLGYVNL